MIAELSEQYASIIGADESIEAREEQHIQEILSQAKHKKPKRSIRSRAAMAAGIAAAFVFTANCISVAALDMNIFKAIVHYSGGGFSVDFSRTDSAVNDDPYGIRAECEKYGISPEVPHYLPEGFTLSEVDYEDLGEELDTLEFFYYNGDMDIVVAYDIFTDPSHMNRVGFPSDKFNIEEIQINGKPTIKSKEDNQCTLVYAQGNILMSIFTVDVPYPECDRIIASIR